jgi:glycosyltransferase involved in cell wall biosynthesis
MNKYYDYKCFFYDEFGERAKWWKSKLPDSCVLLNNVYFRKSGKYLSLDLFGKLKEFDPDLIVIGGFSSPSSILTYLWAKYNNKKTVVITERSRNSKGQLRGKSLIWYILRIIYNKVDLIMTTDEDIVPQFRDVFGFGNKVVAGRYSSDLDQYFSHPIRIEKKDKDYSIIFPNRLTEIYNPILAIKIFEFLLVKYPNLNLYMNAVGELRYDCESYITNHKLSENIQFLDDITSWNDLSLIYKSNDIMILPANFSNGNFTILEAMASGMGIVISDNVLGVGKLIENNINGYNVPNELLQFADVMSNYIESPELFEKHSVINRQIVRPFGIYGTAKFMYELIQVRVFKEKV